MSQTALTLGLTLDLISDPPEPAFHLLALQPILPPNEDEIEKQQQEQGRGIYQLHSMAGVEGHRERHVFPEKRPPNQLPQPIPLATFESGLACFLHLCPRSIERGFLYSGHYGAAQVTAPSEPWDGLGVRTELTEAMVRAYLPAGWPPQQHSSSSTANSMREAPGQWKQEQRLPRCRKLLLHVS